MRSVVVLLAVSLLGADRPKGPEAALISYELKILDMEGLGWRSSLHAQLDPVARQGPATVWTASRDTASKLAERAARVVDAPSLLAQPQVVGSVFKNSTRKIVSEVVREADGPVDHASFVGFVPHIEDATEGYSARINGRTLDQGVLASLTLEDRQITTVHSVALTEAVEPRSGHTGEKTPIKVTIQIPEYARTSVSGEWLIPKDGVLVVSLGLHTAADAKGKAIVRERLVVIEAESGNASRAATTTVGPLTPNLSQVLNVSHTRPAEIPLPTAALVPTVPSRSLPQGLNASGQPVPLPPLPEFEAPVTMIPGTSLPCASAQLGIPVAAGEPIPWKKSELRDTETNRAGFTPSLATRPAAAAASKPADDQVPPCCGATDDDAETNPAITNGKPLSDFRMLNMLSRFAAQLSAANCLPQSGSSRSVVRMNETKDLHIDLQVKPIPSPSTPASDPR